MTVYYDDYYTSTMMASSCNKHSHCGYMSLYVTSLSIYLEALSILLLGRLELETLDHRQGGKGR